MAAQFHAAVGPCLRRERLPQACRQPQPRQRADRLPRRVHPRACPPVLGMFIGAPLVAREVETAPGPVRLDAGRYPAALARRAGRLAAARRRSPGAVPSRPWSPGGRAPRTRLYLNAFNPGDFDVQGIIPAAYSLFAMALGIAAGTLIRRVLPALGVTLVGYFGVRLDQHGLDPPALHDPGDHHVRPRPAYTWRRARSGSWRRASADRTAADPAGARRRRRQQIVGSGFPVSAVPADCLTHGPLGGAHDGLGTVLSCLARHGYRPVHHLPARDEVLALPVHRDRHLRGARRRR